MIITIIIILTVSANSGVADIISAASTCYWSAEP